ncbi:MAG: radical SAM protein [Nanoarchaeota archaeon]|nr:radical SAM protein [Nanoarchaeota archaeon]MBU4451981.1 radical SAM protein [Nanoarchaeota archaeon]MCG2724141.1 radical SAM protein [archaeon]
MTNRLYCAFSYECNNNCLHCAADSEKQRNLSLSIEDIERLLKKIDEMKDVEVELSGGEPTLKPELYYFLARLTESHPEIKHVLLTNGRTFSNPNNAAKLSEYNPYSIFVPLHADTRELHDKISGAKNSFDETMLGLKNMYEYRLPVNIKTVVNKLNYQRMPNLVEMVAQTLPECKWITLNGLELSGRALKNKDMLGIRISDTKTHIEKAIDMANKYGLRIATYSIPPCILSKDYWKYVGRKRRNVIITKTPTTDMKRVELTYGTVPECKECRFFNGCTGAWYSYFEVYGKDELKPVIK